MINKINSNNESNSTERDFLSIIHAHARVCF